MRPEATAENRGASQTNAAPTRQVVTGTENELLRAWRTYSDFSSLARTVRTLGAHRAVEFWSRLDQALGRRGTDPSSLRTEIRLLGHYLTTVLEELDHSEVGVSTPSS